MVGPGGRPQPGRPINSGGINPNTPGLAPTTSISVATTAPPTRTSPARTPSYDVKSQPQPIKANTSQPLVSGIEDFQKMVSLATQIAKWRQLYPHLPYPLPSVSILMN